MSDREKGFAWRLWIPVILAFLLLITAWTTLIVIANKHPTERIPTESSEGSK